jgi:hypothetical protein
VKGLRAEVAELKSKPAEPTFLTHASFNTGMPLTPKPLFPYAMSPPFTPSLGFRPAVSGMPGFIKMQAESEASKNMRFQMMLQFMKSNNFI